MKTTVSIVQSFAHGARVFHMGETGEFSKGEAEDLRKSGLVAYGDETAPTGVTDSKPAEDDLDDLVGGDKAEPAPQNKMEPAPANKGKKK